MFINKALMLVCVELLHKDVLRFMDIFLVEGRKAIFRMAFALLQLVKVDLEVRLTSHVLFS